MLVLGLHETKNQGHPAAAVAIRACPLRWELRNASVGNEGLVKIWNAEAVAQSLQCQNHVSTHGDWLSPQKFIAAAGGVKIQEMAPWYCCVIWKVDCQLLMKVESNMQLSFVALPRRFYSWHHVSWCNYMIWFKKNTIQLICWIVLCPKKSGFKSSRVQKASLFRFTPRKCS